MEQAINALLERGKAADNAPRLLVQLGMSLFEGKLIHGGMGYAHRFFREAALLGDPEAMYYLAMCYRWGEGGVYADPEQALEWFRKAAEAGDEEAKKMLQSHDNEDGKMLFLLSAISGAEGSGSKWYVYEPLVKEYYANADAGNAESQYELARQLANPNHVGPFRYDPVLAIHYYTKAALQGVVDAMYNLAELYYKGAPGVEVNRDLAKHWWTQCAEAGDAESEDLLKKLF